MLEFVNSIRPYLEILYFIAGIIITGGLGLTYRQLILIKRDMRLRSERSAKEKAIEACQRYFSSYILLANKRSDEFESRKLPTVYKGPIGDFSSDSVPESYRKDGFKRFSSSFTWTASLNELESISATFTSGVADEKTAYQVIGRQFCFDVVNNYDLIAASRIMGETEITFWCNIVKLYLLWSPRLEKKELEALKRETEDKISHIQDKYLSPHGVDG